MDAVNFISSLIVHYPFKHDDVAKERAWNHSFVLGLRQFSSETLERASTDIINSRADRRFPILAECRKACFEAERTLRAEAALKDFPMLRKLVADESSPERVKLADEMACNPSSAMCREAARNGWIGA